PGPTRPFGMVQLSPDTRLDGWDGCGGYHDTDSVVYGFSHTHLSGTGIPDYCDILVMPTQGPIYVNNGADGKRGYSSRLDKSTEKAWAGYYACDLIDHRIKVELTASERVGFHRYTFKGTEKKANLILDLNHRDKVITASLRQIDPYTVEGQRVSSSWAKEQIVYFVLRSTVALILQIDTVTGNAPVAAFQFDIPSNRQIQVAVALSAVDAAGAMKNLLAEAKVIDFDDQVMKAEAAWNKVLGKVRVTASKQDEKIKFYTALYHTLVVPNLYQDVDGRYRGMDTGIHQNQADRTQYTVFSLWDTYRAAHPLYTLLEPKRCNDFIQTFLNQYQQGGLLPVWELAANETNCMIGYHAVPVIADAWLKGIRNYNSTLALEAMQKSAKQKHYGLEAYQAMGYIPAEKEGESVSKTLEYAYDDWCIARVAEESGLQPIADSFYRRASYYQNLFDPSSGFFRARFNQFWAEPFDPYEVNNYYTEANAWQYRFYAPQDIDGLMDLLGGPNKFEKELDNLFSAETKTKGREQADITGLKGQYVQGNEPSHHMAYLYNFCGKPAKTQALVSELRNSFFFNMPDGLPGNEDCGQMSAWYVFSALGFYPVTPGTNQYIIGSPAFDRVNIYLENGKTIEIIAAGAENGKKYIKGLKHDGKTYLKTFIEHQDLVNGGSWEFEMSEHPQNWGSSKADWPSTSIPATKRAFAVPFIASGKRIFDKSTTIALGHIDPSVAIYYTLDGKDPKLQGNLYEKPFELSKDTRILFAAKKSNIWSNVQEAQVYSLPAGRKVELHTAYGPMYSAGGDQALIDRIRGELDYKTGNWQGFEGKDLEFVIDLGREIAINQLTLSCLQDQKSWILLPKQVGFSISSDSNEWVNLGTVGHSIDQRTEQSVIQPFTLIASTKARFIKVVATNGGLMPDWHLGAGGKSWIFVDECIIE
ncbi:MAG: GH92 family glycosyl hydrolase, partial [Saprospiraceae bacterium]